MAFLLKKSHSTTVRLERGVKNAGSPSEGATESSLTEFQTNDSIPKMIRLFGISIWCYMVVMQSIGFLVSAIFNNIERNFNRETFIYNSFHYFLSGFIYGSFFLAYSYYRKNRRNQEELLRYNNALSASKIAQLKGQLNPHFLFNNLNILDQLIEEDKKEASDFLLQFSDIYRYVLQSSDQTLIALKEEIAFVHHYMNLLQKKFGAAYLLEINGVPQGKMLIPLTLQLLIENVVQHNVAYCEKPIKIEIDIGETLRVKNNIVRKKSLKTTSGRALKNLEEQYRILLGKSTSIVQTETFFEVTVPLLSTESGHSKMGQNLMLNTNEKGI